MDGLVTRKVELRGIGVFSTFRIYFAITLVFSIVGFIAFRLFGMQVISSLMGLIGNINSLMENLRTQFPNIFENEILSSVFAALVCGVVVGLMAAVGSAIFSIFATLFGGVKLKIREKTQEKKPGYL